MICPGEVQATHRSRMAVSFRGTPCCGEGKDCVRELGFSPTLDHRYLRVSFHESRKPTPKKVHQCVRTHHACVSQVIRVKYYRYELRFAYERIYGYFCPSRQKCKISDSR